MADQFLDAPVSHFDTLVQQAIARMPGAQAPQQVMNPAAPINFAAEIPGAFTGTVEQPSAPKSAMADWEQYFMPPKPPPAPAPAPATVAGGIPAPVPAPAPAPQASALQVDDIDFDAFEDPFKLREGNTMKEIATRMAEAMKNGDMLLPTSFTPEELTKLQAGDWAPMHAKLQETTYRAVVGAVAATLEALDAKMKAGSAGLAKQYHAAARTKAIVEQSAPTGGEGIVLQSLASDFAKRYSARNPGVAPAAVASATKQYMEALRSALTATQAPQQPEAATDWSNFR